MKVIRLFAFLISIEKRLNKQKPHSMKNQHSCSQNILNIKN